MTSRLRRGSRYRLLVVPLVGITFVLLGVVFFGDINGNLVYYLTPSEAVARHGDFPDGRRFRLGGLVEDGSMTRTGDGVDFTVVSGETDHASVRVVYRGAPSQLFQAGIGVIVEGSWQGRVFQSDTMIVKHDEEYRPPNSTTPADRGAAPIGRPAP